MKFKRNNLIRQLIKFGMVGGIAFLIDYSVLYVLTEFFEIYYMLSSIISFIVSVIFNYIASVKWVFDVNISDNKKQKFMVFVGLSIIGLLLNQFIMYLGTAIFNVYYMLTKIFATFIVMIYNFITRKLILERETYKE